jgi:heme oxygenase
MPPVVYALQIVGADCQTRAIAKTAKPLWNPTLRRRFKTIEPSVLRRRKTEVVGVSVQSVASTPSIVALLRSRTQDAHSALEAQLGLLDRPASRDYYADLLRRFLGFHLVWEKGLQDIPTFARALETRSRLQHLRHDLKVLGLTDPEISYVPLCGDAHRLTRNAAHALGSFYVLEGSTLGGQLITKHLSGAAWLPADGLSYFNPYGARTGQMWRSFKRWLESQAERHAADDIVSGARATFMVLQKWLSA